MYVVANRIPVNEVRKPVGNQSGGGILHRAGRLDQAPGFVRLELLRSGEPAADSGYIVLTHWTDKAAFDAWIDSEDHLPIWSKSA